MNKHHAKHKKHHENSTREEAGFLSFDFKKFMNRRDKFLILAIALGIVGLVAATTYMLFSTRQDMSQLEEIVQDPSRQVTTPYPTVPLESEIKETTVLVNSRSINPQIVRVQKGGSVGFFNEETTPVTIQGYDSASEVLNIGAIAPLDVPVVVFEKAGTYRYLNPANPNYIAQIIVE